MTIRIATQPTRNWLEEMNNPRQPALLPVEDWNPPYCGDIDMRIARDGTWYYCGSAIRRLELVRLFSSILRKEPQGYVLVTPVEKVGIKVEDAPFTAIELAVMGRGSSQLLHFRTNVGELVEASACHPLEFTTDARGGLKPYIHVRGELWALVTRGLSLDIVNLGETSEHDGALYFGVYSAGRFFPIVRAQDIGGFTEIWPGTTNQ